MELFKVEPIQLGTLLPMCSAIVSPSLASSGPDLRIAGDTPSAC